MSEPALVDVPEALLTAEAEMSHMTSGVSHGSRWIAGCSEQMGITHTDVSQNRLRFSQLAVFYGWMLASDHQFIYQNSTPQLVHSVDHGHFFPGSTGWTADTLAQAGDAVIDQTIVSGCSLTDLEVESGRTSLNGLSDAAIALAVAYPPAAWGITDEERVAVATYIARGRDTLLAATEEATNDG